jgi:hypothetical protein
MEQSLEWSRMQHEQSAINSSQEPISVFNDFENDDDSCLSDSKALLI